MLKLVLKFLNAQRRISINANGMPVFITINYHNYLIVS